MLPKYVCAQQAEDCLVSGLQQARGEEAVGETSY